jgi:hypothetical protein
MSILSWMVGLTAISCIIAVPALASSQYHCKVTQVLYQTIRMKDDDPPPQVQNSQLGLPISEYLVGKEFWISTTTGEISGELNSSSYAKSWVLQQGSNSNSFKLFVEGYKDVSQNFIYGEVVQFAHGPLKPFTIMGLGFGDEVLIGNCTEQ